MGARLVVLLIAGVCLLQAVESDAVITVERVAGKLEVGAALELRITYGWPSEAVLVRDPDPAAVFGGLVLDRCELVAESDTGGRRQQVWELEVLVPRSGAWALPRPVLQIRDGQTVNQVVAEEVLLTIGVADEPALQPPRELWRRPDAGAEGGGLPWWSWLIIGPVVGFLLGVIAWLRRGDDGPQASPAEVFVDEVAYALHSTDGKQAGAIISLALRRYSGARFDFDGPATTAEEVVVLTGAFVTATEQGELRKVLGSLDSLRWSPDELTAIAVRPFVDRARAWVERIEERLVTEAAAEEAG